MKIRIFHMVPLLLLLSLAACGQSGESEPQADVASAPGHPLNDANAKPSSSMISSGIQMAMEKAKRELASKNIDVNTIHIGGIHTGTAAARPKAEITPGGELLIAGKPVSALPAQRTLLLDYRKQLVGIADAGMDIGAQGADLGIEAAKQALFGKLAGRNENAVEATIRPQADRIRAAALALCARLPSLLSSQQKLAAAVPEFRPYATMRQEDVDDCGKKTRGKDENKGFAVFSD